MATYANPGGTTAKKPKWTGIIWAIVIFVVTAIIGIVMIAISIGVIANAIDDLAQVDAGGSQQVSLGTGDQYVFAVADTRADLLDVRVQVEDPSGTAVRLRSGNDYSGNSDGLRFESIGYIDVTSAGTYTVTVDGPPGAYVRIGTIPIGKFLGLLLGGIAIGAIGFLVALVIFIIALVRRSRVKKANRQAALGGPPVYGQVPGQPYAPQAPGEPYPPGPGGPPQPGPFPQPYGNNAPPPAPPSFTPPPVPPAPATPPPAPEAAPPTPAAPTPPPSYPPPGSDPTPPAGSSPEDPGPANPA